LKLSLHPARFHVLFVMRCCAFIGPTSPPAAPAHTSFQQRERPCRPATETASRAELFVLGQICSGL
jgi:hypothetical protein